MYNSVIYTIYSIYTYIHRICTKYDLAHFIYTFKHSGQFLSTIVWKRIINRNINEYNHNVWLAQTEQGEFKGFRTVHPSGTKPSVLWISALKCPHILYKFTFLVRLLTLPYFIDLPSKACEQCGEMYVDPVDHFFNTCVKTQPQRERFWQSIQALPIQAEIELNSLCNSDFSCVILGAPLHSLNDTDNLLLLQNIANPWYLTDTDYFN